MKATAVVLAIALVGPPALAQQAKPEPLWPAFAAVFDANAPINISGKIVKTEWLEPKSVIWVTSDGATP